MPTAKVTVGTCRNKTTAEEMISLSDVSPGVPCTAPHTLETYWRGAVPAAIGALGPRRPGPEILTGGSGSSCPLAPIRPYLGADTLDSQWGVSVFMKFPTRAEWATGERTVLCDLVVSTASPNTIPRISVPLRNIMRYDDSARVRLCRIGHTDRVQLTCDLPHTGERAGSVDADGGPAARAAACTALAQLYVGGAVPAGFVPTAFLTASSSTTAECWVTRRHGTSRGTLRAGLVRRR